jgi:hypothetical protein
MEARGTARRLLVVVGVGVLVLAFVAPQPAGAVVPKCFGESATMVGTGQADILLGTPGPDVIVGKGGPDLIKGRGGPDLICGGPGPDMLRGGGGADMIRGQGGDDDIKGGAGIDMCEQNAGTGPMVSCENPAPEFDVDGSWSGMTTQSKEISFEVADHAITMLTIGYMWSGPGCMLDGTTEITFGTPPEIVNNSFTVDSNAGGFSLHVDGTFGSDTSATGNFNVSDSSDPVCPGSAMGTWDANKA